MLGGRACGGICNRSVARRCSSAYRLAVVVAVVVAGVSGVVSVAATN